MKYSKLFFPVYLIILSLSITGCATIMELYNNVLSKSTHHSSSVVKYLYPNQSEPIETPTIPTLSLPLKVGIAFVPESKKSISRLILNEKEKTNLMNKISAQFKEYDFVKTIEIIPSAYLRPGGSFTNLDQIRTMYGIDVIVLLAYDQVQFTDEGMLSLSYWTLVGAYIVKGEINDTSTMIDATVYQIPSRKMLFRAPGTSQIENRATFVNLSEKLRKDSLEGYNKAANDLVANLKIQLEIFKDKVRESPEEYKVVHRRGYTGGGAMDEFFVLLLFVMVGGYLWSCKNRKQ